MIAIVAGCEIRVLGVQQLRNVTKLKIEVVAPTRSYNVTYFVDDTTLQVISTHPGILHREMRAIHGSWRDAGIMSKVMVPLSWYQRLMGVDPQTSYRRFFTHRWWEEVQG